MALTTPPSASANSYVTEVAAAAYFTTRPAALVAAEWTAANTAAREAALIAATQILEQEEWTGYKVHNLADNALSWPRSGVLNRDGQAYPSDSVPAAIQYATAELAALILAGDVGGAGEAAAGASSSEVSAIKVGEIELKYDTAVAAATSGYESGHSSAVDLLIKPFIQSIEGIARLVRG